MSGSRERPSSDVASGGAGGGRGGAGTGGGSGGSNEEDGIDGPTKKGCPKEESGHGCQSEAKRVSLFGFRKGKKKLLLLQGKRRRRAGLVSSGCFGKLGGGGGGDGCCLCIKQPLTLDSSAESPTSDPNSKEFTYNMLRVLIEKNDFYAKECNPHLDSKNVSSSSCSHEDEK